MRLALRLRGGFDGTLNGVASAERGLVWNMVTAKPHVPAGDPTVPICAVYLRSGVRQSAEWNLSLRLKSRQRMNHLETRAQRGVGALRSGTIRREVPPGMGDAENSRQSWRHRSRGPRRDLQVMRRPALWSGHSDQMSSILTPVRAPHIFLLDWQAWQSHRAYIRKQCRHCDERSGQVGKDGAAKLLALIGVRRWTTGRIMLCRTYQGA